MTDRAASPTFPSDLLRDRVALVTGAAQGNGRAIALGLSRAGASVGLWDVNADGLAAVADVIAAEGGRAHAAAVDVADRAAVAAEARALGAALGPLSILVNNAGIIRRTPLDADAEALFDDMEAQFRVNALGAMIVSKAFLDPLVETKGAIVNVGSICSEIAYTAVAGYAASKGAIKMLTKALAVELAPKGVRVNGLEPGVIATPMTQATRDDPARIGAFLAKTPMGRVGEPEELVGPVVFLASDWASYITGAMLPVDGGYLAT